MIVVYQKKRARVYKGKEITDYDCWSYRVTPKIASEGVISWWLVPGTEDES